MFRLLFQYLTRKGMKLMLVPKALPPNPAMASIVYDKNGHKVAVVVLTDYSLIEVMSNHALRTELAIDAMLQLPECVRRTFGDDVLEAAIERSEETPFKLERLDIHKASEN